MHINASNTQHQCPHILCLQDTESFAASVNMPPIFNQNLSSINVDLSAIIEWEYAQSKTKSSQQEIIQRHLKLILSDHLQLVADAICNIFIEALTDESTAPKVAKHFSTIFSSNLIKKLPASFQKFANAEAHVPPELVQKHSLVYFKATKELIGNLLSNSQLKEISIDFILELILPIFQKLKEAQSTTLTHALPEEEKKLIVAALKGLDEFFKDLVSSKSSCCSSLNISDFKTLNEQSIKGEAFEESLFDEMEALLRKKGMQALTTKLTWAARLENNFLKLAEALLLIAIPNLHTYKEKEALIYITAICIDKLSEAVLSPRTMLYVFDLLLNSKKMRSEAVQVDHPPKVANDKRSTVDDPSFSQVLDVHFQNLVTQCAHLGTVTISSYLTIAALFQGLMKFNSGKLGKSCTKAIYQAIQSSNILKTINTISKALYRTTHDNVKTPILKNYFMYSNDELKTKQLHIKELLQSNILFHFVNHSFNPAINTNRAKNETSTFYWNCLTKYSNILQTFCLNFGDSIFAISQRTKLMKMLQHYIVVHVNNTYYGRKP